MIMNYKAWKAKLAGGTQVRDFIRRGIQIEHDLANEKDSS